MPKSEGLPLGRAATPGVPLLRLLLLLLVPFLLLLLRPWLPQFLGAPALPIPASHTIPGGRKNKNHTKPAKEKSNPLEPEVGAPPPSLKKKRSRLAGAANVTIETSPETLSAEAPPPLEPPGLAAQRGPPRGSRRGGGGDPRPGRPVQTWKRLSRSRRRAAPPSPRGVHPGTWTHPGRPALRLLKNADGRTDRWTAAAGAETAGAGGRRRRCSGPATSQCGRASGASPPRAPQRARGSGRRAAPGRRARSWR